MIKTDCIHFVLDRPCAFHKESKIICSDCDKYQPIISPSQKIEKILIIKLDAMGDVLRTTSLLPDLKKKYPKADITWIVKKESLPILEKNPYINTIWILDNDIFPKMLCQSFDEVINLDLSPASLTLATIAVSKNKKGFWLNSKRQIKYSNFPAFEWLQMSGSDIRKKQNKHTYQHFMSKIIEIPDSKSKIYVPLLKESLAKADNFSKRCKLNKKVVVGINPGAGKRWKLKKWTDSGYIDIINKLLDSDIKVLLFGGPQEKELISYFVGATSAARGSKNKAISTGTDNSIPDFFALLNLCDLIITGDTLALHASLGLNKKVIGIFGPTSSNEIEMYGQGIKIVPEIDCLCCYMPECNIKPNCMQLIKPETVWNAITEVLHKD